MSDTTEGTQGKPFHETIVDAIRRCPSTDEFFRLSHLIVETDIPEGHEQILAAIDAYFDFPGSTKYARSIREVKDAIKQNQERRKSKGANVNLDHLQREVEQLLALLKDRQSGLVTWNVLMCERFSNIHGLLSRALGK